VSNFAANSLPSTLALDLPAAGAADPGPLGAGVSPESEHPVTARAVAVAAAARAAISLVFMVFPFSRCRGSVWVTRYEKGRNRAPPTDPNFCRRVVRRVLGPPPVLD